MASLAICAAALGLWCVSSNRQAQQDAAARDAAAVSAPTAGSDDEPEWEAVVEEVVGLRREGVWCLAVLLVGLVILGVGLFLAWVIVLTVCRIHSRPSVPAIVSRAFAVCSVRLVASSGRGTGAHLLALSCGRRQCLTRVWV